VSRSIFIIRTAISRYYSYRIAALLARLREQEKEREATIIRLKAATKYDSTAALLAKYGGDEAKKNKKAQGKDGPGNRNPSGGNAPGRVGTPSGRTGLPPPPTANIVRPGSRPGAPPPPPHTPTNPKPGHTATDTPDGPIDFPAVEHAQELARLRGAPPPQQQRTAALADGTVVPPARRSWQERLLESLFGEDELLPQHRLALVCDSCRQVNGLAAPGIVTMQEVGPWRCSRCFHMNNGDPPGTAPGSPAPPPSAAMSPGALQETPITVSSAAARPDEKNLRRRRSAKQGKSGDEDEDARRTTSRSRSASPATPASTSGGSRSGDGGEEEEEEEEEETAASASGPSTRSRRRGGKR
jgi:hypothetical protein